MDERSTPFAYPVEGDSDEQTPIEIRTETLRKLGAFINERILAKDRVGSLPSTRTIAARLVVMNALLYPDRFTSLAAIARELGCSRAWLSKIGIIFADSIGMRASWQRINARKTYAERARGVHAGTWKATSENGKWERRRRREARRTQSEKKNLPNA